MRWDVPLGRRATARAIDLALALLVLFLVGQAVPADRPLARLVLGAGALVVAEALFVLRLRATPGKLASAVRVAALDRARIAPPAAWIRAVITTAGSVALLLSLVPGVLAGTTGFLPPALRLAASSDAGLLVGGSVLLVASCAVIGVVIGPFHRGLADRAADTVVVPFEAPELIRSDEVGATAAARALTAWGLVADAAARRRARADRLDDAPLLVVGLAAVILAWALDPTTLLVVAGLRIPVVAGALALAWSVVLVVDETWRISREAGTAGHHREGLVVVARATGEAPPTRRSFVRALVLAACGLLPPLLVVLLLWVALSPTGRGPHDLLAGTVVVERPGRVTA